MSPSPAPAAVAALRADNRRMLAKLAVVVALMFGFGYALVPVYRAICNSLGINVLSVSERRAADFATGAAADNTQVDASRTISVEFDANARGPWDFKPEKSALDVHPGQLVTVMYELHNRQSRPMVAQAIPSYAPQVAMPHFNKVECFCFTEHTLGPGEKKSWPVTFVVDARLPRDVRTITLSYTFFEVGGRTPAAPVAAAPRTAAQGGAS